MRNKKFLLGIGLVSLLYFGVSCGNDFLSPDITNSQTTDSFYQTEAQVEQGLNGLYNNLLRVSSQRFMMSEVRSDNVWVEINTNAQRDYSDIGTFRYNITTLDTIANTWNNLYLLVSNANTFLQKIENVQFYDESLKDQFRGEARFLRALAYYDLVRYYGRIPLILEPITQEQALQTGQSSAKEIYEQAIIPDLEYAASKLPETPVNTKGSAVKGKATWMAAKALLGHVYTTMSGYPLYSDNTSAAKTLLKEVIDYATGKGKFWASTSDQWLHIWTNEQDNNYHIFEIQYVNGGSGLGNPMVFESCPGLYSGYTNVRIYGNSVWAEDTLVDAYLDGSDNGIHDIRLNGTVDTTKFVNTDVNPAQTYSGDPFFVKFLEHKIKRAKLGLTNIDDLVQSYYDWPINFPIIRLEDVMLMYAELVGPTAEGLQLVNKIRTRAGLAEVTTTDPTEFQAIVARERRLELAGEGHRWHDLVRWGIWKETIKDMFYRYAWSDVYNEYDADIKSYGDDLKDGYYLYPIPEKQILVRDGLYEQNEAYR